MIAGRDRDIIRDVAKRVVDVASLPVQRERRDLWKRHNRLEPTRPMLLLFPEGSWNELIKPEHLRCTDPWARNREWFLRSRLYHHEHFGDDTVTEKEWVVAKVLRSSGWGLEPRRIASSEQRGAWHFDPVIHSPHTRGGQTERMHSGDHPERHAHLPEPPRAIRPLAGHREGTDGRVLNGSCTMNGHERLANVFAGSPVDRIPAGEDFWGDTIRKWVAEGHLREGESPIDHFGLDMDRSGLLRFYADMDFGWKVLEESDEVQTVVDGNGATLRLHKLHASTPEHVAFRVRDQASWEGFAKPHLLQLDERRIPFEAYRKSRRSSQDHGRHFSSDGFGPFELMTRLMGHEELLMAMALEPEWVRDMVLTYANWNICHWEALFAAEGLPDSTWIADDLGFKFKPFMSPQMFDDVLRPGYEELFGYLHSKRLKVILHSCGYIEPLVQALLECGVDCLEAMEFKAGMDLPRLFDLYGPRLVFCGNVDIRALESNCPERIDEELNRAVLPLVRNGGRYILHSDHSISPRVEYATYRHLLDRCGDLLGSGHTAGHL